MNNKNNLVVFENTELQVMVNNNNEIEMDMDELAKALGFKDKESFKSIILREKSLISESTGKRLHSVFYWTIIGWYKAFCNNKT